MSNEWFFYDCPRVFLYHFPRQSVLFVWLHSFHIAKLLLCPVRIVTQAFTKTHKDESSKNKPSSDCQESIYWWRWLYSPLPIPPPEWPPFTQGMPPFPTHPTELLLEMGLCYRAPGGSQQGLEAVKSRPLQPWTAPPLSQSQRGKDLNLEWPHQAKSPMGSSTGHSSGSPHP